ncbi:MAG: ribonuclease D, partial [Thermoguttaceae bacterium]
MSYLFVESPQHLALLLEQMRESPWIALDTEFISEGRYESQLCLVQIAYNEGLALIDPLKIPDLSPFWEVLCDGGREVVVHAGRSEMEFCYRAIRRFPEWLFDVQLAAGFIGIDYPAGFRSLVEKLLG